MVYGHHEIFLGARTALLQHDVAGGVAGRSLACGMHSFEKRNKRCGFRWAQVFSVSRHVPASLNHLADELVLCKPHGNTVECWASLSAEFTKRMAIAALLGLKHESSLPLKCRGIMQKPFRYRIAAPGIHVRTPGSKSNEMCKCPQRYCDQQDGQNRNRPPPPTLFSFTGEKRQEEQTDNHEDGPNEECRRLERRWKQRKQGIKPEEKVIRLRHGLNDRRVRPASWSERTEIHSARCYG